MVGALLFWSVSLFLPRERVAPRDIFLLLLASVFGIQLNQMLFLWGLSLTSPIDLVDHRHGRPRTDDGAGDAVPA